MSISRNYLYMSQFAFILGNHSHLSCREILCVLENKKIQYKEIFSGKQVYIIKTSSFDPIVFLNELGGTIKIVQGEFINEFSESSFFEFLSKKEGKITYAMSCYQGDADHAFFKQKVKEIQKLARSIKKYLKQEGLSSRFIEAKEFALTSAQVSNNGLIAKGAEFVTIIFEKRYFIGKTIVIQSIKGFQERDMDKPCRSMQVGMMPPKLARIMINIAQIPKDKMILDPFCGMGTILIEAMSLGYMHLGGSDIAKEQVQDTKENIQWAKEKYDWKGAFTIKQVKVEQLSSQFKQADAIVTEPFLGKILSGNETKQEIDRQLMQLTKLYHAAFQEFERVLNNEGKIVMIIPEFHLKNKIYKLHSDAILKNTSFKEICPPFGLKNNIYMREGQFVARQIYLFKKS